MSFDSSILKVNCYCGYKTEFDREKQEKIFGDKLLIADISIFYEKLSCLKCKKKYPEILSFSDNNETENENENEKKLQNNIN